MTAPGNSRLHGGSRTGASGAEYSQVRGAATQTEVTRPPASYKAASRLQGHFRFPRAPRPGAPASIHLKQSFTAEGHPAVRGRGANLPRQRVLAHTAAHGKRARSRPSLSRGGAIGHSFTYDDISEAEGSAGASHERPYGQAQ